MSKKFEVYWELVNKISPAFKLRNSGVPAVARSFQLACRLYPPDTTAVEIARLQARRPGGEIGRILLLDSLQHVLT
jgi:hypothetical protein